MIEDNNNKINYVTVILIHVTCDVLLSCEWIYIILFDAKITSFAHESSSFIERDQNNKMILPSLSVSFFVQIFKSIDFHWHWDMNNSDNAVQRLQTNFPKCTKNADSVACKFSHFTLKHYGYLVVPLFQSIFPSRNEWECALTIFSMQN